MAVNVTSKAAQTMFSSTIAHSITPRTVATWSPLIPRTPRVLVPVQLDALVIRPNAAQTVWADCRMKDPPDNATTANRRDLLPPPFTNKDGSRPPGVYLHWALPDALTRGQASGSDVTFPAIPDRWLVVRFYPSGLINERRAIEGWVLRAGDYPKDGTLPQPIPLFKWTETGPSDISTDEITAMGRGDAAWSAYYDNVENRLGFYDSLSDIRQGPLAYLVCGWYSNTDKDPLSAKSITSLSDFYATMAAYQWKLEDNELEQSQSKAWQYISAVTQLGLQTREAVAVGTYKLATPSNPTPPVTAANTTVSSHPNVATPTLPGTGVSAQSWTPSPAAEAGWQPAALDPSGHPLGGEYKTNGSWWPELTLYHGAVVGIGWPTIGWEGMSNGVLAQYLEDGVAEGEFGGPPKASDINVMVGTTQTDALASLVAKARNNPDEARMLEAFILGSLSDFDLPDGPARTDALLQASAFFSRDGGSETEQIWIPAMPPENPATPTSPAPANTGIFSNEAVTAHRATAAAKTIAGATPKFVDRATAPSSTTASTAPVSDIGHVYSLGAQTAKFSEVTANASIQGILQYLHQNNFTQPVQTPGHYESVQRAFPRLFQPSDPVILIQGGARAFRSGKDGRYNSDGTLSCRLTGFTITELACRANGTPIRPSVKGDDLLTSGIENGSVPPECQDLLLETVLLDPGASVVAAQQSQWMIQGIRETTAVAQPDVRAAATTSVSSSAQQLAHNFVVEQTAWWSTRDPRVDHGPLLINSGYVGTLPSVVAVTMPRQPWAPIHLDWEVQYVPSANGVDDWNLDENDFIPNLNNLPSSDAQSVTLKGRAHLTAGIADTVAAAVRQSLTQAALSGGSGSIDPGKREAFLSQYSQSILSKVQTMSLQFKAAATTTTGTTGTTGGAGNISQIDRSELNDIASALENMDVLCGALDAFHQQLRGGIMGDGTTTLADGQPVPNPFFPMRAGFLRIVRLRLVDGFGQTLDLAGSSDQSSVNPALINASIPMELDNHPNLQLLPPRFTSPSRLWLRFSDASGATDSKGAVQANSTISPICGFVLPNHLDGALEFFDANGQNQGVLRPDAVAGVVWEDSPGLPSTVGQTPERAISNQFSGGIARGLLDWGTADADLGEGAREDALSAFLRIIDSTLWSVDPFGHHGDEHLSLLIGHPVAVVRASVRLEVQEPITPDVINKIALPLRLGALKHWQDGLLGYFINDDYRTFYCSDAAVAGFAREVGPGQGFLQQINSVDDYYQQFADDLGTDVTSGTTAAPPAQGRAPVNHPYVNDSGLMTIRPNQEIKLTLLVEPQALVHGTGGLLPRKDIGFRRSWIATGLANISPTFRFGPVLVDPKTIKMPVAVESFGSWSWDHRATITAWAEDKVVNATQDAILPIDPVTGSEGWLRLMPNPPNQPTTTGEQNQE
jgi:hypothetical protein